MDLKKLYTDLNLALFNNISKDGLNPVISVHYTENHYNRYSAHVQLVGWTESVDVFDIELDDENEFELADNDGDNLPIKRTGYEPNKDYLDPSVAWILSVQLDSFVKTNSCKIPISAGFTEIGQADTDTIFYALVTLHKDGITVHNIILHSS